MTEQDIERGRLIIEVGLAPVRPAEFIMIGLVLATQTEPPRAQPERSPAPRLLQRWLRNRR